MEGWDSNLQTFDQKTHVLNHYTTAAPRLIDFLGAESLTHFETVTAILDANEIAWTLNPRLVRGMDYYNLTVFEFVTDQLGSQGTICGGGRYDYLMEQVGAKAAPAVGWALGVERVLELLKEQGKVLVAPACDVYAIIPNAASLPAAIKAIEAMRAAGTSVQMHASAASGAGMGSMKSQFKRADSSGAAYAVVFGEDEMARGVVSVKSLRDGSGAQVEQALSDVSSWAPNLQSRATN